MNFEAYKTLSFSRRGRILTIILNRPEALNAVDGVMHEELSRVFIDAARDEESDAIVLTGAGKAFCAGGDFDWLQEMIDYPAEYHKAGTDARRIVMSILECDKPIIAKVNGAAVGLGATLALFSDVIFAQEGAKFGDPHVSVGFVAGDGGAVIWPQLIGYARAKEYLMTGDLIPASDAARIGLINHVVPAAELDARVDEFVDRLHAGARQAIRWTKVSVNIGLKQLAASILDASLAYEMLTNYTADHSEAVAAFRSKRKPVFSKEQ
ncbi:enoyl-CoA hydratase/isomerase family protein [Cupriavidus oxalaticus]|uniref:enoyl-CoA hydratase/isomerase family protein n=1 Tax=Cupriavidus oxalaticus TaxID=96344 RepID=UPI003170568B